jgi:hypothetical protein
MSDSRIQLSDLIAGDLRAVADKVEQELRTGDSAGSASIAWSMVKSEAAARLHDALKIDVLELVATAWSKAKELKKYGDTARYPPDQSIVVHLGEHAVSCRVQPVVEVLFNEVSLPSVRFNVELVARFKSAALNIRGGVIREVLPGACSAQAVLRYGNVKLKEATTPEVRFPGRLGLGNGIRIN